MSRIPNAVAFTVFIGIVVTLTNTLTARPGTHGLVLLFHVIATLIIAVIVAAGVWVRGKLRQR